MLCLIPPLKSDNYEWFSLLFLVKVYEKDNQIISYSEKERPQWTLLENLFN